MPSGHGAWKLFSMAWSKENLYFFTPCEYPQKKNFKNCFYLTSLTFILLSSLFLLHDSHPPSSQVPVEDVADSNDSETDEGQMTFAKDRRKAMGATAGQKMGNHYILNKNIFLPAKDIFSFFGSLDID